MPFDNHSKVGGADWISEACAEVLSQRMSSPHVYVISRDDRLFAFDRAGVPAAARPSRATIFRVAEQMGADFVVLGSYEVSDSSFEATAQLLDVKGLRLDPVIQTSGTSQRVCRVANVVGLAIAAPAAQSAADDAAGVRQSVGAYSTGCV